MPANYALNPRTGKIHIVGYCHLTKHSPKEWEVFETEEQAQSHFGAQSAGICKNCLKEREKRLSKEKK